ncbi:MAG: methyltransferase domain-containing protein [Acidimicrobiales bacterium]
MAIYDAIGLGYRHLRRPDPRLAARIEAALGPGTVCNVGAGTGSYEPSDREVVAVEPSAVMRSQRPAGSAPVVDAVAEALPFADGAFDAALAVLTVHHWVDRAAGLGELARASRRQVVFTFDPAAHLDFWLVRDYFPEIAQLPGSAPPSADDIAASLGGGRVDPFPVPADCVDGFLWAYWARPAAYLDPGVRGAISALAQLEASVVARGAAALEADLASGRWLDRNGHLLAEPAVDGGFRLVVAGG